MRPRIVGYAPPVYGESQLGDLLSDVMGAAKTASNVVSTASNAVSTVTNAAGSVGVSLGFGGGGNSGVAPPAATRNPFTAAPAPPPPPPPKPTLANATPEQRARLAQLLSQTTVLAPSSGPSKFAMAPLLSRRVESVALPVRAIAAEQKPFPTALVVGGVAGAAAIGAAVYFATR